MKKNERPLIVAYGYPLGTEDFEFVGRQGLIQIGGYQQAFIAFLPLCNGLRTVAEIAIESKLDYSVVVGLINVCERHGLITDSRELYRQFHLDSANPSQFSRDLSLVQVGALQERSIHPDKKDPSDHPPPLFPETITRQSVRSFADAAIPPSLFDGLLGSMYRVQETRSVPSGGALYPLTLYVFLLRQVGDHMPGIYRYDSTNLECIYVRELPVREEISRVFDTREIIQNATALIAITGSLDRSPTKYANRGYRYTLLEAGHVAQNAYLYSTTHPEVGVVEYGGFLDEDLADLIGLSYPAHAPLITLICGVPDTHPKPLTETRERDIVRTRQKQLVGAGKPIEKVGIFKLRRGPLALPRWAAIASHRHPNNFDKKPDKSMRAFATSPLIHEALAKVMSEAYERFTCLNPYASVIGPTTSLTRPYLDPNIFVPYEVDHPAYVRYGLTRFSPDQRRGWVKGTHLTSAEEIMVPCDLLFFTPHPKQREVCYRPNSSGVAAHPSREKAIENGFLELVERDALAVIWYSMKTPNRIPADFVPEDIHKRTKQWLSRGWDIRILEITLEQMPTVLVLFRNKRGRYPALASGGGCALTLSDAIQKAFVEAEYMALSWMRRRHRPNIEPEQVRTPDHHGLLYASGKFDREIEFLFDATEQTPTLLRGAMEEMVQKHNPVVVDLNRDQRVLSVCRLLSATLLPMTFGYASEHPGHSRFEMLSLGRKRVFPAIPHFFP